MQYALKKHKCINICKKIYIAEPKKEDDMDLTAVLKESIENMDKFRTYLLRENTVIFTSYFFLAIYPQHNNIFLSLKNY